MRKENAEAEQTSVTAITSLVHPATDRKGKYMASENVSCDEPNPQLFRPIIHLPSFPPSIGRVFPQAVCPIRGKRARHAPEQHSMAGDRTRCSSWKDWKGTMKHLVHGFHWIDAMRFGMGQLHPLTLREMESNRIRTPKITEEGCTEIDKLFSELFTGASEKCKNIPARFGECLAEILRHSAP